MRREGDSGLPLARIRAFRAIRTSPVQQGIADRIPAESSPAASRPSPSAVRRPPTTSSGFTLVELVVVLTISTILVGFIALFISAPVGAYFDQSERSALNESAEVVSRSFAADLRSALPNSVRIRNVGSRSIVEMLKVESVSFYFPSGALGIPPTQSARELDFGISGDTFSVFGRLDPYASANPYTVPYLVVSNHGSGVSGRDAYRLSDVITPGSVSVNRNPLTLEETVVLPAGFSFTAPAAGPTLHRIFVVSGPITYICNSAADARRVRRYSNYSISANIPTSEAASQLTAGGAVASTLATNVASCNLRCGGGGANVDVCQDTLIFEVAFERPTSSGNELLRSLEQISLDNRL